MRKSLFAMALLLAGCGGGGGGGSTNPGGMGQNPPPPVVTDVFIGTVTTLVMSAPDETEPADIAGVSATSPEDTEPVAVTP